MANDIPLFANAPAAGGANFLVPSELAELLEAPVSLIIGAPGTGKTSALAQLVSELESKGLSASQVLVLTPSRNAASALRNQLALQSEKTATGARAQSISSFCFGLIQKLNPDLRLLSGAGQQNLISEIVESLEASGLAGTWGVDQLSLRLPSFHIELRDLITVVLEHSLSANDLGALGVQFPKLKHQILKDLLPIYLEALEKQNYLDPSTLIARAKDSVASLKGVRYVLIDDAQNLSQAGLELALEMARGRNLVMSGDPDSATNSFRSADPGEFILATKREFKNVKTTFLQSFQPQPKSIASAMARIAQRLPTSAAGLQRKPFLQSEDTSGILATLHDNQQSETDWLAANLRKLRLTRGLDFSQMVVVGRTRRQLEQLAISLSSRNVPVRILGSQAALRDQFAARAVLDLGKLIYGQNEPDLVEAILLSPFGGFDSISLRRLVRQLAQDPIFDGLARSEILSALVSETFELDSPEGRKLEKLKALIRRLKTNPPSHSHELVSMIFSDVTASRWAEAARGDSEVGFAANRDLDSILELFAAAQRFDQRELGSPEDFVIQQLALRVPEDSLAKAGQKPAVLLATPSQLAGQSFEVVAMPRLQEGIWPNLRPRNSLLGANSLQAYLAGKLEDPTKPAKSELADELRMAYRTIGACRSVLLLSAMQDAEEQPSQLFTLFGILPDRANSEIDFDLRRLVGRLRAKLAAGDQGSAITLASFAAAGVAGAHPSQWLGLFPLSKDSELVSEDEQIRISASKLEAFERCPLHWFIGNFGGDGSGFAASLGTLIHAALENAEDIDPVSFVESNWHTLDFETQWQQTAQKRRAMQMVQLMSEYLSTAGELIRAEQGFELRVGKLIVSGKIDRVEKNAAGEILVSDLKTGRVPTKLDVEKNRQLALYQMAVRVLHQDEPLAGAQIISVGSDKLRVLYQAPLSNELEAEINALLEKAEDGISGTEFIANYQSHCNQDSSCQLLLARAVTDA
ncbi:ATP-dependent DNA helicase [Candidatus Aquiluna sp. UB-MaderosW2red]|uniref:ATP-dependent DNA helicase n=1 Tax=Candidatus Aquiluna sp. UB-MaderosW2red TaxID=1855377 RepID=UPI000875DE51|nr:ATP-dependent DNA helicase [Candidatus Aquiluna sp. UB-MaderosW2red]SCX14054.1 Superfamily I DNA or RNA helicase [Candidatus Aquiluna sp. UB-MaderosW2red]